MSDDPFDLEQMTPAAAPDTPGEPMYIGLLNPEQRSAVEAVAGPLLVLAGAGSGKTRVLTFKLLHQLIQKLATPNQILAVTFTNKAASEMKNRVSDMLSFPIDRMWLGTFHSLSLKILRSHYENIGLSSNFIIIDSCLLYTSPSPRDRG